MTDKELIENLERIEAVMISPCFKADMEAIKGQMLELLDKMTLNTMERPDVVAVVEIFLEYLRQEEQTDKCKNCKFNNSEICETCSRNFSDNFYKETEEEQS